MVADRGSQVDRAKALEMALGQIEKQFGKGSIMKLGERGHVGIEVIPTGARNCLLTPRRTVFPSPFPLSLSHQMIFLLGGSGYVGSAYQALLTRKGLPFRNVRRADFDYTDRTALTELLRREKPAFLINAAGYTGKPNVDACELHKSECLLGNAVLPGTIALACADAGVPWGHVSSGCIYTGARPDGSGFTETDTPNFTFRTNNCSFYSGTKGLGEEVLD